MYKFLNYEYQYLPQNYSTGQAPFPELNCKIHLGLTLRN